MGWEERTIKNKTTEKKKQRQTNKINKSIPYTKKKKKRSAKRRVCGIGCMPI
jgi:hypothetical protein